MVARHRACHDRFVVHAADTAVRGALTGRGRQLEVVPGPPNVVVLRLPRAPSDPRSGWQRVRAVVGPRVAVDPLLVDDAGHWHYPTGRIAVRFSRRLSDAEAARFSKAHELRLLSRNAYVPSQLVFEPVDRTDVYLPDIVETLGHAVDVTAAWPETVSEFKRLP